jgi:hypothetical protein
MTTKPSEPKGPCFVVRRDPTGKWRWMYYDTDNTALAVSAGSYTDQMECLFAAEAMKACAGAPVTIQSGSGDGRPV